MSVVSLIWTWAVIAVVCAASCAVVRWVGQRVDNAEKERSRRQWQLMCNAVGAEDLSGDHANDSSTTSPTRPRPAPPASEMPTEAVR